MQQCILGRTGLSVSRIVLGTMTFNRETDAVAAADMLDAALDAGVNCIDCANTYADGASERLLGRLLASRRDQVVLTSKVCGPTGPGANDRGLSRRHIIAACEASLRRLGTDHLDIYFMHYPDPHCDPDISLRAMDELVRSGKVRCIGASNHAAWQYMDRLHRSERLGLEPISVIQPQYNLLKRTAEVEILPMARHCGLGVMSYSPLGAGILTGKYANAEAPGRLQTDDRYQARYGTGDAYAIGAAFAELAQAAGWAPATLASAWALRRGMVDAVIVGARSVAQLAPALAAGGEELDPELSTQVERLVPQVPLATDRDEERV